MRPIIALTHFAAFVTFDAAPIRTDRGCRGALAGHMSDALTSEALCLQNGRTIPIEAKRH